jgi:hypothetical protein
MAMLFEGRIFTRQGQGVRKLRVEEFYMDIRWPVTTGRTRILYL